VTHPLYNKYMIIKLFLVYIGSIDLETVFLGSQNFLDRSLHVLSL
jgi:hypothetical protein